MEVKAWQELVKIPTYKIGDPDKNPMFLEKRVYQGSSGVVYPHPVIDKVYDEKEDKEWTALFLENEYLKVMILPELGGRIQMAYDKTNDYHFVYYNQVIKPALVGLAGPWISGGIEFNWPQHHRPSTFDATDFMIEEHADGSRTVWVNEYEIMFRTKCSLGFTLHPGKAYIELHAKLHNRTPFPQTFLWWANPAVAVDEHYQSVFPPDVHAVYDHGKRDVSSFPIATGTYYKVDYSPGTDISIYTNIPVPTSYMAVNSEFNFVGGYHHQKKAGMIHVADHHVSPGKKQWTWGCGEFGKAWDRQLTDEDGPYFELMCGVYTDNQPDFSWIMPNEVREFSQYFMPYKNIGYVKNASVDAMVNFDINGNNADIKVYVTCERVVKILLKKSGSVIHEKAMSLSPEITYEEIIPLQQPVTSVEDYSVEVLDEEGRVLINYSPVVKENTEIPEPAKAIPEPSALKTNEELYLAGLHLEQYRHGTYCAEDYYAEAILRDPTDIRNNNALGLLFLRRGEYQRSEKYFRSAIEKLNKHNPNTYDSEPLYNLGLALKHQGRYEEAYALLYKSTWSAYLQDNAFLQLAFIEARNENWNQASSFIKDSLARNLRSPKARHLKTIILRKLGKLDKAARSAMRSLELDAFNFGSRYELYKVFSENGEKEKAVEVLAELKQLMREWNHNYIEIAIDYANAGQYADAFDLLHLIAESNTDPLTFYYLGYFKYHIREVEEAKHWFEKGFHCSPDRVFPNRLEDIEVLKKAIEVNSGDYKALYYLGNFYYAKRRYEDARKCWEQSVEINDQFPTVLRNLGIAWYNKFDKKEEALRLFEKAFDSDTTDSRILYELDQLYKRFHKLPEDRLFFLKKYEPLIAERDDLYIEYVLLHTLTGRFHEAKRLLETRNFHPWEGGEGKTSGQHIHIHVEIAKNALRENKFKEALELLQAAEKYPENLGEGKLYGAQENDIHYWMGCAYEQLNEMNLAQEYWRKASVGLSDPLPAIYYNDQQPDKIFYQGLALLKLGDMGEAIKRFNNLVRFGETNMNKEVKIDYFAVSLPDLMIFDDDLDVRNQIHCHYLLGLGWLGLELYDKSEYHFDVALRLDPAHPGAIVHKTMLNEKVKSDAFPEVLK
ncbi:DUF5107 domain-containing protein [Terrimonas pollutisoli]|uniref:DUF5107 domain-containing protein n=1 Tax=Terrimonas pollutisoli TaxID=3034147 RepID=UPI0023EDA6F6|nr:DUF5107 domain-containing protein [Terrimonas sp. H1YJ31]